MENPVYVRAVLSDKQFTCNVSIFISAITGDCWQGELCKQRCLTNPATAGYVGSIGSVRVCCPFCERSGLHLSPSQCNCRHNGPDPRYQPTEDELREVRDFLNGAPSAVAMTSVLMSTMLTCLCSILRF